LLYLNSEFSHVKNFFQNILLKTASLYDIRLQNYGAINFVQFFWTTLYNQKKSVLSDVVQVKWCDGTSHCLKIYSVSQENSLGEHA